MNRLRVCLSPSMERSFPPVSARMLLVARVWVVCEGGVAPRISER
jgi:hypothetical protein